MMKTLLIIAALVSNLLAQPRAPYIETLKETAIRIIPLHSEIDTLLVFPDQVDSIIGNGLAKDGSSPGFVLFQQGAENPKTVILRHLDSKTSVLMTVMSGDQAFVFKLEPSETPATVIRFQKPGNGQAGEKIDPEQALLRSRPLSEERKTELLRLARESSSLREKLKAEYEGYSEKAVAFAFIWNGLETKISRVSRFSKDDALTFSGTITNLRDLPADLNGSQIKLRIGEKTLYPVSLLKVTKTTIPARGSVNFQGLLLGDGAGNALHPSIDNAFNLQLTRKP
jgi:hypothetical protein